MSTRRELILEDLRATVAAVSGMGTVYVNRTEPIPNTVTYPCCVVRTGSASLVESEASLGRDEWSFSVRLELFSETSVEALYGLVHTAVMADIHRGAALADSTRNVGQDMEFQFDVPASVQALAITYDVRYECAITEI